MPGYGAPPMLKGGGQEHSKMSPLGPGGGRGDVFAPSASRGTIIPEKATLSAFPDADTFRSAWSGTMQDTMGSTKQPPWLMQLLLRVEKLEASQGEAGGGAVEGRIGEAVAPGRLMALEEGLKAMQAQQQTFRDHERVLLKKLTVLTEQLNTLDAKVQANAAAAAAAASAPVPAQPDSVKPEPAGGKGGKAAPAASGKVEADVKLALSQLADQDKRIKEQAREAAEHEKKLKELAEGDKKVKEQQRLLVDLQAQVAKLQVDAKRRNEVSDAGAGAKGKRTSDAGAAKGKRVSEAGAGAGGGASDAALLAKLADLEEKQAMTDKALMQLTEDTAAALEAAIKAQADAELAAAASGTASQGAPSDLQASIESVVGPMLQQTASEVAALGVRVAEGEQQAQRSAEAAQELQAALAQLQQQVQTATEQLQQQIQTVAEQVQQQAVAAAEAAAAAAAATASAAPPASPAPDAEKQRAVEAQILLAIGAKLDKMKEQQVKASKVVELLSQRVETLEASAPAAPAHDPPRRASTLMTIEEVSEDSVPKTKPAAVSSDIAETAKSASQMANQAMGASSKALTQAAQALALANSSTAEMASVQAASKQQQEVLGRLEQMCGEAGRLASVAHNNVLSIEQVCKTLMVKIDTLTMEFVQVKAKVEATPNLSAVQAHTVAASMAGADPGAGGGSGSDPRVPAILVDLRQLATGLGELAGKISVTEREFKMALPTLARTNALKELETSLLDKQQQLVQEVEALKRGGSGSQVGTPV